VSAEGGLQVNSRVTLRPDELTFRFSRSSGPGGQNVNKLETRVEVLFNLARSPSLTDGEKELARSGLGSSLDAEGVVHVVVSDTRSQLQNRQMAMVRLRELLRRALRVHRVRRATRPPPGAIEARLGAKRRQSTVKRRRRPPPATADQD
jgi:ribosome-associated protein